MGCSPALEDRPGGRDRAPSLAEVVDKGAYTDRVGYTHPTPALRLRPTPDRLPTWRGPRRPKTNFVDKGAVTPRLGCAPPTTAPGPRPDPSQGRGGLSDPRAPAGAKRPPRRPRRGATAAVGAWTCVGGRLSRSGSLEASAATAWKKRSRPAASTSLRACGPARPAGSACGLRG
jgi:hypothetical protein